MTDYFTRDYYLAAYLIAKGCSLVEHQRKNGTTEFRFESSDLTKTLVNDYYSFKALINPINFGNAMRSLKTIIQAQNNYEKPQYQSQTKRGN